MTKLPLRGFPRLGRRLGTLTCLLLLAISARAAGPYRNTDNPNLHDSAEGTYPIPYHEPTVAEITRDLTRVRGFLETALPARMIDRRTRQTVSDYGRLDPEVVSDRGDVEDFSNLNYTMGVVHAGMIAAAAATGDRRFADFTARQLDYLAQAVPYFRRQAERYGMPHNSFRSVFAPAALDDCGAMTAGLIKARLAGVGPDLSGVITHWADYLAHGQFRLADGTLARTRPQPQSVWADDFYMAVPALAQLSRLTGERHWLDDAVRNARQMEARLVRPATGLFAHGWTSNQPDFPAFYWARANGWAMMAQCELLDVLPPDDPARPELLRTLRRQIEAVAALQSGAGLWHQLLDRNDSYLETSASAMYVYSLAHAVNEGWISPVSYGSVAQAGWFAVAAQINPQGLVENTCVGTTFAGDAVYYYNRPVSPYALHGYGPVLLAGAEMIRLLHNPRVKVQLKDRAYHYMPVP